MVVLGDFQEKMSRKCNHDVEVVWHRDEALLEMLLVQDHFEYSHRGFMRHTRCREEMWRDGFAIQAFKDLVSEVELAKVVVQLKACLGEIPDVGVGFEEGGEFGEPPVQLSGVMNYLV